MHLDDPIDKVILIFKEIMQIITYNKKLILIEIDKFIVIGDQLFRIWVVLYRFLPLGSLGNGGSVADTDSLSYFINRTAIFICFHHLSEASDTQIRTNQWSAISDDNSTWNRYLCGLLIKKILHKVNYTSFYSFRKVELMQ